MHLFLEFLGGGSLGLPTGFVFGFDLAVLFPELLVLGAQAFEFLFEGLRDGVEGVSLRFEFALSRLETLDLADGNLFFVVFAVAVSRALGRPDVRDLLLQHLDSLADVHFFSDRIHERVSGIIGLVISLLPPTTPIALPISVPNNVSPSERLECNSVLVEKFSLFGHFGLFNCFGFEAQDLSLDVIDVQCFPFLLCQEHAHRRLNGCRGKNIFPIVNAFRFPVEIDGHPCGCC